MKHRDFTITPAITQAAGLLRQLDRLRHADAQLLKAAVTDGERQGVRRAIGRRRVLHHAIAAWLSAEPRAQSGLLPLGGWED